MKKVLKKSLWIVIIVAVITLVLCWGFFGQTNLQAVSSIISDSREVVYTGGNEKARISLMCGTREEPYVQNGLVGEKTEFGIVKVDFIEIVAENAKIPVTVKVGTDSYSATLEKSPYDSTFYADIGKKISTGNFVTVEITTSELYSSTLECVSANWQIDADEAVKIAIQTLEEKNAFKNKWRSKIICGKNLGDIEARLQIISNDSPLLDKNFWYFCILTESSTVYSCVIDPMSGNIMAETANY